MTEEVRKHPKLERPEVLNQDGKVYVGEPNPDTKSAVKVVYRNEKGQQVCSATRSSGLKICVSPVINHNGRCRKHGGKSLTGIAHPKFKNGKYSNFLPERLISRYEEALADTKLADFSDDLAVVDARLADLFIQLEDGGGGDIFSELKEAYTSFTIASQEGDRDVMRDALRRMDSAIKRGSSENYLWTEIRHLQDQRRKIILAQGKHLKDTNQLVKVSEVNVLVAALIDAVQNVVKDRAQLNAIESRFRGILNAGSTKALKA